MGSKSEDWWQGNLQKYSIKRFSTMSVYLKFRRCTTPYSKGDNAFREAYWKDENCFIYEWFDRREQRGEKFGLDHNSTTYFYENWYVEEAVHVVVKSWLCGETEWGVVIKYFPEFESVETWSLDGQSKILETKKVYPDKTETVKTGKKFTPDGLEDFTEKFWTAPGQSGRELSWNRGNAEGEEKEFKENDKAWGESWEKDGNDFKKTSWNEEPGRKWGESSGKSGPEEWDKVWDRNPEKDFEEEKHKRGDKEWGTIRSLSNDGRYNIDWEGQKPIVSLSEPVQEGTGKTKSAGLTKKKGNALRSDNRESPRGRPKSSENDEKLRNAEEALTSEQSKNASILAGIGQGLKDDLSKRIENDFTSFDFTPEAIQALTSLKQALDDLPSAVDSEGLAENIHHLRRLAQDLDSLEKSIVSTYPTSSEIVPAFAELSAAASSLHSVIDPSNQTDFKQDLAHLTREIDSVYSPKEKFQTFSQIAPLLRGILNFQSKAAGDFDRKSAEITELLSSTLKGFEEVIKESQETLSRVRHELKENDDESGMIENAYSERGKKLINDIETFVPYTKTLPELSDLLRDMEKFKRELLSNKIAETLKDLRNEQADLTQSLLKGLKHPEISESLSENPGILTGLDDLKRKLAENKALALKAIGIDSSSGNPLIDQVKPANPDDRIDFDAKALLKSWWINGQTEQNTAGNTLKRLANSLAGDEEKTQIDQNLQQAQDLLTGVAPSSDKQALDLLKTSIEQFVPLKIQQSELLDDFLQKFEEKVKAAEVKPETLLELWKGLTVADRVSEKLLNADPPKGLVDLRKQVEGLIGKTDVPGLSNALIKYQEVNLGLINGDEDLTAEELKELADSADKRAGGKGKSNKLSGKPKQALRSGRGVKKLNVADPSKDLIEKSLSNTAQLALWVNGSRPTVQKRLQELQAAKEPVVKAIEQDGGSEEAIDGVFNMLSNLENEKSLIVSKGDLDKSLKFVIQKAFKVLESTSSILNTAVPVEALELQSKSPSGDLSDLVKRIGFFLSIFFKMVKEATGASDEGDNLDEAMAGLMKKQVVSLLPFDPLHLLEDLKAKNNGDIRRLKFLAGLVGTDEDVASSAELEKHAVEVLHEFQPKDNQEAMQHIDHYLHKFPAIDKEITSETEKLLADLLRRLTNPEPLERDVAALIAAGEKLEASLRAKGLSDPVVEELSQRKESLPTKPEELIPYLTQLVNDYATQSLQNSGLEPKALAEEGKKVASVVAKKIKCAPVLVLRDIQHLFAGPGIPDTIELILKLDKAVDSLMRTGTASDPALYAACIEGVKKLDSLTPCELKELAKDYADLLLGIVQLKGATDEVISEIEELSVHIVGRRRERTVISLVNWADIFKSKGLDLDAALVLDTMVQEQEALKVYLNNFAGALGNNDQKNYAKNLVLRADEILKIEDEATKIQNYFQLRLEQSKLLQGLSQKGQNVHERLSRLDLEKANSLKQLLSEVEILAEKNSPDLKSEVQVISTKEQGNLSQSPESTPEILLRLASRLDLEKQLQRIKSEAKPVDNSEAELIKQLSELEQLLYTGLKALWQSLSDLSSEVGPQDLSNLKIKTEQSVSTSVPALFASLKSAADTLKDFAGTSQSLVAQSPVRSLLGSTLEALKAENGSDDNETEVVFSGLFRLVGSADDKAKAKKLREARLLAGRDASRLVDLSALLAEQLQQFLPVRTSQSNLMGKLVKEAGALRESIDDVDIFTEDIMNKALREVANTIMPDDPKSRSTLDSIRKAVDSINEVPASNIPEALDRTTKRLENWEKLEKLRRELREKQSKEINRLKSELQDKLNEIETNRATLEGVKTQYEAQLAMLQNTAQQHSALIEKLTQEAIDKEKEITDWRNKNTELTNLSEEQKDELEKLRDEVDSDTREIRNLRRAVKDKDTRIRELEEDLEVSNRTHEKNSLGDKEKTEIFEKIKDELKTARDQLQEKSKALDDAEDKLGNLEREKQKLELELAAKEKELEAARKERSQIKAELLSVQTERSELLEKAKLNEGVSKEDMQNLERILEDKQKELDEVEENLAVAKRYQLLYLEMAEEKQENDEARRELEINLTDSKRKADELKQENDQLKFKTRAADQALKDLSAAQKENQKLQMRLDFLQKASEKSEETSELAKKLSDEISAKDSEISDLLDEIARLKALLEETKKHHDISMIRSFLVRLMHAFKEQQGMGYRKWKAYKKPVPTNFDVSEVVEVPPSETQASDSGVPEEYRAADDSIKKENLDLIQHNPVMSLYNSIQEKGEKVLSVMSFFKFMDELMEKKLAADKQDQSEFKEIRTLENYLPDYLTKTLGIQSLAMKFLSQLVPTLHCLGLENNQFAIFYQRLLHMFHPEPIYHALTVYLVKVRAQFQPLLEKYERAMAEPVKKGAKKGKAQKSGKNEFEWAVTGGKALLTDVIELIYQLFNGDREAGVKALELLKPEKVTHEDFVAFKICHKMAKLGKTPEMIFNLLDKDKGGTIDTEEFITGTKDDLDLWISDENVQKLMTQLDKEGKGEVSKESFLEKISMKALMQWNKDPNFAVTKSSFLMALVEVHKFKHRKLAANLSIEMKKLNKETLNSHDFETIINHLDSSLDKHDVEKMFLEAAGQHKKEVQLPGILKVASKYGLGDVKSFRVRELLIQLSRSKNLVAIMMGSDEPSEEQAEAKKKMIKSFLMKKG